MHMFIFRDWTKRASLFVYEGTKSPYVGEMKKE